MSWSRPDQQQKVMACVLTHSSGLYISKPAPFGLDIMLVRPDS
ncbi:hypothetical protein MNBD_GAMMA21-916 [hydrothermal vent metagenome]|uniref:Uncharacterized protein n=1 Tax=hydrothermal vent metagenome TaxID=652676 RepID=A0A3B0ZUL4_9ZZZZ